ncbi:MAG TPA: MBL fold metallo-hydrolase [Deltaproteobacteria bacterium]|nr:MBL fold metallo-hydrolase [Deltaproteobacteria bacterium]
MRPAFNARLVNGPLFDPVVHARLINRREALLFDCGHFLKLANREMLRLNSVFVSHMHMDHFMGFDRVLRAVLHREKPLHVYGPEGVTHAVISRLSSYTWNLAADYPLSVVVHEIHDREELVCTASARGAFAPSALKRRPRRGHTVEESPHYCVDTVVLDHNVPCLGFVLREHVHIHIRPDALGRIGCRAGEWLGVLREKIALGLLDDPVEVPVGDAFVEMTAGRLMEEIALTAPGQKMAFFTDFRASRENIERVCEIAHGADLLFIETYYLADREGEAYAKGHLSARQAGALARMLEVSKVVPMHVSPRYHDRLPDIVCELDGAWHGHCGGL